MILDEAGMVDHKRMDDLTELIERSGAKLVAVGDGKQLPSIGPGGMFDRIAHRAPTLSWRRSIARATRRSARRGRRCGPGNRSGRWRTTAPAGQLFLTDTRDEAGEAAVKRWAELTETREIREVALITDASNVEIDRLNARAQHLRAERGELGQSRGASSRTSTTGCARATASRSPPSTDQPGQPRVENGARGEVTDIDERPRADRHARRLRARRCSLAGEDLENLRLGYAQHVYRQQGATVERTVVVTGGWQTSRESSYVQASRARHGTEWYVNRDELDLDGHDERLARASSPRRCEPAARTHRPSQHRELRRPATWGPASQPRNRAQPQPAPGPQPRHRTTRPDRDRSRGRSR